MPLEFKPLEFGLPSWLFETTSASSTDVVDDSIAATISSNNVIQTPGDIAIKSSGASSTNNNNVIASNNIINNYNHNNNSSPSVFARNCSDISTNGVYNNISHDNYTMVVDLAGEYPLDQATILFGYITPFVVLLSIMTNLFVVAVLTRRHMRTGTNIILCTLSMVDLSTILIGSPWYFYIYTLGHYKDNLNWFTCYSHSVFIEGLPVFLHNASIWLTLLLAGQRYFCIRYPVLACRWCTKPRIKQSIGLIIVAALVSQLTRFFDNEFVFDVECNQCKRTIAKWVLWFGTDIYFGTYFLFRILFVYLIPCVSLVTLNCLLYLALKRAERKRTELLGPRYELEEVGWDVTLKEQPSPVLVPTGEDAHNESVGCCGDLASSSELRADARDTSTCTLDINDSTNPIDAEQSSTNQEVIGSEPNNNDAIFPQSSELPFNEGVNPLNNPRLKWAVPVDGKSHNGNPSNIGPTLASSGNSSSTTQKISNTNSSNNNKIHNYINESNKNNKLASSCNNNNNNGHPEADRNIIESQERSASEVQCDQQQQRQSNIVPDCKDNGNSLINLAAVVEQVASQACPHADLDDEHEILDLDEEDPDEESLVEDEDEDGVEDDHDVSDDHLEVADEESGLSGGVAPNGLQICFEFPNKMAANASEPNISGNAKPPMGAKKSVFLAKSLHWLVCKIFFCNNLISDRQRKSRRRQRLRKRIKQVEMSNNNQNITDNNNHHNNNSNNNKTTGTRKLAHKDKISTNCATTKARTTTNLETGTVTTKRRPKRVRDSNRTTLMLIVVVTVYLVIEIPSAIVTTLHTIASALNETSEQNDFVFNMANYTKLYSNFLIILSYSLNFSIYCSMSKKFRVTFRDLVTCQSFRKQRRLKQKASAHHGQESQHQQQQGSSFRSECIDSLYSTSPTGSRSQI